LVRCEAGFENSKAGLGGETNLQGEDERSDDELVFFTR
jgi:hypothetical protein